MTLAEVLVAVAILSVLILPLIRFTDGIIKGLVVISGRQKKENLSVKTLATIERDFKDMNEVIFCSRKKIRFYMDSYRLPGYFPSPGDLGIGAQDRDGDGIPNRLDPDDDGDAFDNIRNARDLYNLNFSSPAVANAGWRQGLDLQDDDDDNDGHRDVICEYAYDSGKDILTRQFSYNEGAWTPKETIVAGVVSSTFTPYGSASAPDPNTGELPQLVDSNGNGVFDVSPDLGGYNVQYSSYTRCITSVAYTMTIQPIPGRPETYELSSAVKPVLMAVKEKFE